MKSRSIIVLALLFSPGAWGGPASVPAAEPTTTLTGKLILGYQGWFDCPTDAAKVGWRHWFSGNTPVVDMLPDTSELSPEEKCATSYKTSRNLPVSLFSSQNSVTVERHFRWMKDYGLDGIALQRFAVGLQDPKIRSANDRVLENVRIAAEKEGRTFFIMYDLSGLEADKLPNVIEDWNRLEGNGVTTSSAYQHHRGHPVLGVWGLGFSGRPIGPDDAERFLRALRNQSLSHGGVTLLGGLPAGWRTHSGDGAADRRWDDVYRLLDVISPWTVGRYADDAGADNYRRNFLEPDIAQARRWGVDYMPVVFPGFSRANVMRGKNMPGRGFNQIPRRCGRFFWHQVYNSISAGASMIYGAMFDEVNEGTAMFKVVADRQQLPTGLNFVALDADGCALPSDWYLRLAGKATTELKKGGLVPPSLPIKLPQ